MKNRKIYKGVCLCLCMKGKEQAKPDEDSNVAQEGEVIQAPLFLTNNQR